MDKATSRAASSTDHRLNVEATSDSHQVFAIGAASSLVESAPLVLKHGDEFGVFDRNGDISVGHESAQGLYYRDTRHLSGVLRHPLRRATDPAQLKLAGRQRLNDLRSLEP